MRLFCRACGSTYRRGWCPAQAEGELYQRWVDAGYFTAEPESGRPTFSIVIPPPNMTGMVRAIRKTEIPFHCASRKLDRPVALMAIRHKHDAVETLFR